MTESHPPTDSADRNHVVARTLTAFGQVTVAVCRSSFGFVGGMSILFGQTARVSGRSLLPGQAIGARSLLFQMVRVGVKAVPIVVLIQLAIGMILPLQMFPKLDEFGQANQVATINAIAALRELGPLMTAIILSGFAGASIAAELGTMVTAEEIEALQSMGLNAVKFLVVPRMLATTFMTIVLTVIADVVMVFGGWLTGINLGLDPDLYYRMTLEAVNITSFVTGLIKAGVFGMLVSLIACYLGLNVKPWQGSEGVGEATTNTVVYGIVAIIGADAVFTVIFYAHGLFT